MRDVDSSETANNHTELYINSNHTVFHNVVWYGVGIYGPHSIEMIEQFQFLIEIRTK